MKSMNFLIIFYFNNLLLERECELKNFNNQPLANLVLTVPAKREKMMMATGWIICRFKKGNVFEAAPEIGPATISSTACRHLQPFY